ALRIAHDRTAFLFSEFQQRGHVPPRDHTALPDLELPWIDHGQRVRAFLDDRPAVFADDHLAQVAGVANGKLEHLCVRLTFEWSRATKRHRFGRTVGHQLAVKSPTRVVNRIPVRSRLAAPGAGARLRFGRLRPDSSGSSGCPEPASTAYASGKQIPACR